MRFQGRGLVEGEGLGPALVSEKPISFLGGVDPKTGLIKEKGHPLQGEPIKGRVLIFPRGKGSTVGSYVIYSLRVNGVSPAAFIALEAEPIILAGCAIAGIPLMDRPRPNPIGIIKDGEILYVNGGKGEAFKIGEEGGSNPLAGG
ncbi:MAG: aconitase X swivel domain-containing protein [Candidatus Bathyarchaeia archaeon]